VRPKVHGRCTSLRFVSQRTDAQWNGAQALPSTLTRRTCGDKARPREETMNPFSGKRKNPSVAQSVSDLVAEGGNVLASDDAPTAAGQAPLETTTPANTWRPIPQIRLDASLLPAPRRILLRPSV
jgi:hypothetical protein